MSVPSFSLEKSSEFYFAARNGDLPLVKALSADPEVNLNWQDAFAWTPFFFACLNGHVDVVLFLLGFHDNAPREPIDYNLENRYGTTAFSAACYSGHERVVEMLLEDERIDVNRADFEERTLLWYASCHGHVGVARRILASSRQIDVLKTDKWGNRTAAVVARERGARIRKAADESNEKFQLRKQGHFDIATFVEAYQHDRQNVKAQLRRELEIDVRMSRELFAWVVYLSDGYVAINP